MQGRGHVDRPIRLEIDRLSCHGVLKSQSPCMQRLTRHACPGSPAINGVSQKGMSSMSHVNANLVRASRVQSALNQTTTVTLCQQIQGGRCSFARLVGQINHCHAQSMGRISPYGCIHKPFRGSCPTFMRDCQILTMHLSGRNLSHQGVHRLSGTCNHHQPAGVFVQSVNNAGTWHIAGLGVQSQQTIEQGSTPISWSRVHHQACRLVNHPQMFIFIDHIDGHGLRHKGLRLRCGPQSNLKLMTQTDFGGNLGGHPSVHQGVALFNQLLQIAS